MNSFKHISIKSLNLNNNYIKNILKQTNKYICTSCSLGIFFEIDKHGGYEKKQKINLLTALKEGTKAIPNELKNLKREAINYMRLDNIYGQEHGDYEILWKFNNQKTINEWVTSVDSDHNEGFSKAELILGPNKTGIFSGKLDTTVPRDGIIKRSGYCNIRSPKNMISFYRQRPYEFDCYTHFIIRLRGDGRVYNLDCQMDRYFDLQWQDMYTYLLYTRGGPYWQIAKIPFSKFFLTHKGRIMDKQEAIQKNRISHIGITLGDSHSGPFHLEIDYIAVVYDSNHTNIFEYEMYEVDPGAIN